MMYPRRRFLKDASLVAGLSAMAGSAWGDPNSIPKSTQAPQSDDWSALRDEFDLDYRWRNFAGFLLASPARIVREAFDHHRDQLRRNPDNCLAEGYPHETEAREWAGKYFGIDPKQVALTGNTTMGLATVYNHINIQPGQEVLSTEHEHYSSITSLKYRSARDGFRVRTIRLYDEPRDASADEMLGRLVRHITPKTRVLALTWVHSGSSVKLPVAEVGKVVAEANTGRAEADRILLFNLTREESFGAEMTPGGCHSFEHRWALSKAFEFHLQLGKQCVQERIRSLNAYLKTRLAEIPSVQLRTPMSPDLSAGFTFFRVASMDPAAVQKLMHENKFIVSPANRDAGPVVRMAPGLLNNADEIDEATKLLREIS